MWNKTILIFVSMKVCGEKCNIASIIMKMQKSVIFIYIPSLSMTSILVSFAKFTPFIELLDCPLCGSEFAFRSVESGFWPTKVNFFLSLY